MRLSALRERMYHVGLTLAILNMYSDLTHPDVVRRAGEIEHGIQWAPEGFLQAASTAEKHRIQLVFENHSKPGIREYPDFSFPPDVFLRIADRERAGPLSI
jgi:hypothetical protein